jgi:chemotaxis protein CheY-P-specific phosphatase CheC
MVHFTTPQLQVVQKLLTLCVNRTAVSFSKFVQGEIHSGRPNLFVTETNAKQYPCYKPEQELYVLTTKLMGNLSGTSYLIFSQRDIDVMFTLPAFRSIKNRDRNFTEAFLKELDNILSASFISTLANTFESEIYGDVPEFNELSSTSTNKTIDAYMPNGSLSIISENSFSLVGNEVFNPQFIWKFSTQLASDAQRVNLNDGVDANILAKEHTLPIHSTSSKY